MSGWRMRENTVMSMLSRAVENALVLHPHGLNVAKRRI